MTMPTKTTRVYATHGLPLECDIYAAEDYPKDTPVFLYFHPGGLVDWARDVIPPWLVQVCLRRKWPLISPSYRLLPQAAAQGLLEDASAAYAFAQKWDAPEGKTRRVISGGGSGGVFMAAVIAHHCQPTPLALFSIEGINTFRHPFFNSSTLLTPEPIQDADMADFIAGPVAVGVAAPGAAPVFRLEQLRADGSRNPDYKPPPAPAQDGPAPTHWRGMLYDYYTYKNGWLDLVGDIDLGYGWAKEDSPAARQRLDRWPPTVVFHGNNDDDVPLGVSEEMRDCIGADKVSLFVADGQSHLYELRKFLDDDVPEMGAVRDAVQRLDEIVEGSNQLNG